jgi:Raf kinase inhibitor-like YbhB/YbcL family protein
VLRRACAPLLACAALLLVAGCADRGREMREPLDSQTTTTRVPAAAGAAEESRPPSLQTGPDGFTVRLDGTTAGGELPAAMSCEGDEVPPTVLWQNVPDQTAELALSMTDPDAEGFVQWLVVGIDPSLAGMDGADLPPGATALLNSSGEAAFAGPCPPGGERHDYVFTLYALAEERSFDPLADPQEVLSDLSGASVGITTVAASFEATRSTTTVGS